MPIKRPYRRGFYGSLCVYFAEVGDLIKIGCTGNIKGRLSALRSAARPQKVTLLYVMPGDETDESCMHWLFQKHRFKDEDWFHKHSDILKFIEQQKHQ